MKLLAVEAQPNFPATDLSDMNREVLPTLFASEPGVKGHARHLEGYQRSLHHMAHVAIHDLLDIPLKYSEKEYVAFTEGFTDFETISMIVRGPQEYNMSLAIGRAGMHLITPGAFADYEFSKRFRAWPDERPNTYNTIISMGRTRGDTDMTNMQLRHAGAQLAFELQRPPLDVVS